MRLAISWLIVMAAVLGLPSASAIGQDVPTYQVAPTCHAEADGSRKTDEACLRDERDAHDQLVKQWSQFASADKQRCLATSSDIAGMRSYVELLTCLQLAKDVNSLPAADKQ